MEPTVKLFKLISGENIIATTETNCEDLTAIDSVTISDPVLISSMRYPKGGLVYETFVMQPWIAMTEETTIDIATRHILLSSRVREGIERQYLTYLESEIEREAQGDLEDELAQEADSDLFEQMMNEEEEEYYVGDEPSGKPTYH